MLPLSTPVSLGAMCISWCPEYFLGTSCCFNHTLVCYLSVPLYPCISYTRLGTFRYIWCSSVRNGLCGYLYDPKGILCISYCIFVLWEFRKFSLPLATSRYHLVRPCTYLISWYLFLLLGTYLVPTRYLLGTYSVPLGIPR